MLAGQPDTLQGDQDKDLAQIYPPPYGLFTVSAAPAKSLWYRGLIRLFPTAGRIPDAEIGWTLRAARFAQRHLKEAKFEVICSFGNPMSSHLTGLRLKRRWKVPWVAHFSDPWVDNPYNKHDRLSMALNRQLEYRVIAHADAVIFVSEQTRQLVMAKYPDSWRVKTRVIPHSFDPALYPAVQPTNKKLTFRSIGNFYGPRTPEPLFRAIAKLKREAPEIIAQSCFEFIGTSYPNMDSLRQAYQLGSEINIKSRVSYLESLRMMKESDVLVLIDAPGKVNVFLPSKLIDYLGAGRPILGITPIHGSSADILRQVQGMVAPPEHPEEIAEAINNYYQRFVRGELAHFAYSSEALEPYTVETTTRQFARLLEQLLEAGTPGF